MSLIRCLFIFLIGAASSIHGKDVPLQGISYEPKIIWGSLTNVETREIFNIWKIKPIQSGIGAAHWPVEVSVLNTNCKIYLPLYLRFDEGARVEGRDTNHNVGNEIKITGELIRPPENEKRFVQIKDHFGKTLYQTSSNFSAIRPRPQHFLRHLFQAGEKGIAMTAGENTHYDDLEIGSLFQSFPAGNYTVEMAQRIGLENSNWGVTRVFLPPMTFPVTMLPPSTNAASH